MQTDVIMPQMGESVAEGTVTRWLKAVGDRIERDEPLFEISTDKVDAEIPSPAEGFLVEILVPEGETVEINTKVATIAASMDAKVNTPSPSVPTPSASAPSLPAAPSAPSRPMTPAPVASPSVQNTGSAGGASVDAIEAALQERRSRGDIPSAAELRKVRSSPLVRRIAKEHGISLMDVTGSGLDGRVTKADIMGFIQAGGTRRPVAPPAPVAAPAPRMATNSAVTGDEASHPHTDIPRKFMWTINERDEVYPLTPMRKKIAEHMVLSKRMSPHVNNFMEVDMTHLVRERQARKVEFQKRTGVKLTYMPFIIAATSQALQEFPEINASIVGDQVVKHPDINIGVAVALDWGLIVPVIKNADGMNVTGLSRSLTDLASRARNKKLKVEEVAGCTFSITNPGSYGSLIGTPIIPQPNVAILSVGAIQKKPWVMEHADGDSIAIRHIMMTSMSFDHRLVDGAEAAKFMVRLRDILEGFDVSSL